MAPLHRNVAHRNLHHRMQPMCPIVQLSPVHQQAPFARNSSNSIAFGKAPRREATGQSISQSARQADSKAVGRSVGRSVGAQRYSDVAQAGSPGAATVVVPAGHVVKQFVSSPAASIVRLLQYSLPLYLMTTSPASHFHSTAQGPSCAPGAKTLQLCTPVLFGRLWDFFQ